MQENARRYSTWGARVAANGREDITISGNFFRLLSGDEGLQVRIDDEPPGIFPVGVGISCPEPFKRLTIINTSGAEIEVEVAIGRGAIDDNRLTVSGVIEVRDPNDSSSFSDVLAGILAELRDANSKRAALTDLTGATAQSVTNASAVIVAGGSNINGVVIRRALVTAAGATATGYLTVAGEQVLRAATAHPYAADSAALENLYVPPGAEISGVSGNSNVFLQVWYEVL